MQVRVAELIACGRDLSAGARGLADAAGAFDRWAGRGAGLGHPVAAAAYEGFFAAWSLRLEDSVSALHVGAEAVLEAAGSYAQWERFVADLSR